MENLRGLAEDVGFGVVFAGGLAVFAAAAVFAVVRIIRVLTARRGDHRWRSDLRLPIRVGVMAFLFLFPSVLWVGYLLRDACGVSEVHPFPSPDGRHTLVVYGFDCGATTAYSFMVSLLNEGESLPQHRTVHVLYSRYRDLPSDNFEVQWQDPSHAVVRVADFDGDPVVQQDGVTVHFEPLR